MKKISQLKKKEWFYWIIAVVGIILLITISTNSFSQEKPGPTNTGPSGTLTAMSGGNITTDGTLIENKQITGQLVIQANNVTIRNCVIDANAAYYGVRCDYGATNLVIEDCEIINMKSAGIYGENFTARRCNVHESDGDAFKPKTNCLVENCWIHHLGKGVGAHADGVQVRNAGSNMIFRYNNFDMPSDVEPPYKSNSAFILQQVEGPIHCVIEYNWINGGSYTMNLGGSEAYVRYNQFGRDYLYGIYYPNGNLYNECNTWEDTGEPVDACSSTISVTSVSVSPTTSTLEIGQSVSLTETVLPTDATNKSVTWSSDNTAVATVDDSGTVNAIAAGTATITVTTVDGVFTATCAVTVNPAASTSQLMNLDAPSSYRFTLTDRQWPSNIGEAHVCLWNDDKIAAASISIDDNIESQHDWWMQMQDTYNLKFTWFVIDELIQSYNWYKYQTLVDEGNDVQGHGRCAINDLDDAQYEAALDATVNAVETNIPGTKCISYGYPCGDPSRQEIARQKFIVMRGTTGLMNEANKTNYLNLNSRSAPNQTSDVDIILREEEYLWSKSYFRGWLSYHYHTVNNFAGTENFLSYLSQKSDSLWVGTYVEVAQYGQSRDTHTLTIDDVSGTEVRFTLTDLMHDTYFDFPLTVKIRIDNTWTNVAATQNGSSVTVDVITHNGDQYALVKAVPDKGQVIVSADAGSSTVDVTGVDLSQTTVDLIIGGSVDLDETVLPANATDKSVAWSSVNSAVATVDANGLVSAISAGSTIITVTTNDGGFTASCTVSVTDNQQGGSRTETVLASTDDLQINSDGTSRWIGTGGHRVGGAAGGIDGCSVHPFELPALNPGEEIISAQLTINLSNIANSPQGNVDLYGIPYRNSSTVDPVGDYWQGAYGTDGSATAIQDDFATLSSPYGLLSTNAAAGENLADYINAQYSAGALSGDYIFIRLNPDVADVTNYYYWDFSSANTSIVPALELEIGVPYVPISGISVSPSTLSLDEGQSSDLTETVSPTDATDKSATWSSDNTSVATVDANGLVTAVSAGSAIITATTNDGGYTANCSVSVTAPVTGVNLSQTTADITVGGTVDLDETVLPTDASDKTVNWSSDNTSVATVDVNGLVSAISAGSAIVTVTTNDGGFTASCSVTVTAIPTGYLIDEDFASGASNFTVVSGGTWAVSNGRYLLSTPGNAAVGLLGNISVHNTEVVGDFELSTLINITSTTSSWNDAAVIFNYQDANNYYYVSLNESNDSNTKGILKVENGATTELADITTQINDATDYTLEMSKTGADIVVKLDGIQISAATDATFTNGKVGYGTKNDGAQYDDLLVISTSAVWDAITYDDFESGFGSFKDGGGDCSLYTGGSYAHQGSNAGLIQDNQNVYSSFYYLNSVDLTSYSQLKIEFWFYGLGMDDGHDFFVEYSDDGGTTWQIISTFVQGSGNDFVNGQFYSVADGGSFDAVVIDNSAYNFSSSAKIRFRCDGLQNEDQIYIDEVIVTATTSAAKKAVKGIVQAMSEPVMVKAFPNPCQGKLNVRISGESSDIGPLIQLFDISGKKVFAKQMNGVSHLSIPTGAFDKGIYILSVSVQGAAYRQKVIITQ